MKEVVSHLRRRGFMSVIYIDDLLCVGKTYIECLNNVKETILLLECLGFVINYTKSQVEPSQTCKFLGFIYNSVYMTISLPTEKRNHILHLVEKFSSLPKCSLRDYAHLIGVLTAACPAVRYGWVYTKQLERQKFIMLQDRSYDSKVRFTNEILPDLVWWSTHINTTYNPIGNTNFDLEIFTDASMTGWGAFSNNSRASGTWQECEVIFHINYLELLAVFFGLKCFAREKSNCNILLRVDNTTAISYVNRMGGVQFPHLNNLARSIWQWCEERGIWLFASYINTKDNVEADEESRKVNPDVEWSLSESAFQTIVNAFGQANIDLFASRTNAKCETYVSWQRDPEALTVDAFTLNWNNLSFYAFPPFPLILKCLSKIINDKAEGILVYPLWPSQPWFPLLNSLIISDVIYLDSDVNLLPSYRTHNQRFNRFTLAAAKLSGSRF